MYDALPQMGVPVHHRDGDTVLDTIDQFVQVGRRTGRSHQIVTVNTDFLVQARRHGDVHAILRTADLALPDGMPIVWASSALGQPLPGRIAGADLVPALVARAEAKGHRVMFFGGSEGAADRAAAKLIGAHPELVLRATDGLVSPTGDTESAVLGEIRDFAPDIICVALGHPKQERWIRRHAESLSIPVAIGVGGTFEFIAGNSRRAPAWIQRSGFEWFYRLAQDPGRLTQRYLTDIAVYVPNIMMQIARTRFVRRSRRIIHPGRSTDRTKSTEDLEIVESDAGAVVVSPRRGGPLDHHTVAELTSRATSLRREGRELRLLATDLDTIQSLEKLRLDRLVRLVPSSHRLGLERPQFGPIGADGDHPDDRSDSLDSPGSIARSAGDARPRPTWV